MDPSLSPDLHQKLTGSILGRDRSSIQVVWKFAQRFLCNPADEPNNQQTDAGGNMTSMVVLIRIKAGFFSLFIFHLIFSCILTVRTSALLVKLSAGKHISMLSPNCMAELSRSIPPPHLKTTPDFKCLAELLRCYTVTVQVWILGYKSSEPCGPTKRTLSHQLQCVHVCVCVCVC